MASLITAGGISAAAAGQVAGEFVLQMGIGAAVGVAGGRALLWFMRAVPLPSEGLYPLRTAFSALILFGAASLAHGSGFLAVFVAGILLGDERAPYKREIERFHSALASFGEIVAFVVLGLALDLAVLTRADVLVPGLVTFAVLGRADPAGVRRAVPAAGAAGGRSERAFVLFAGLKGAVPILLGSFVLAARGPDAERLYGIVVVVVLLSVLLQGSLVPTVARLLRLPMRESATRAVGGRGAAARRARRRAPLHRGGRRPGRRTPDRRAGDAARGRLDQPAWCARTGYCRCAATARCWPATRCWCWPIPTCTTCWRPPSGRAG